MGIRRLLFGFGITSLASVTAFLGAVLPGCGDSEKRSGAKLAQGCSINSDCNSPLVCAFERCHEECKSSRDCKSGRCVSDPDGTGVCQLSDDSRCDTSADCRGKQECAPDDVCRDACEAAKDCLEGQTCTSSVCADESELVDGMLPGGGAGGAQGAGGAGSGGISASGGGISAGGTTASGGVGGASGGGASVGGASVGGASAGGKTGDAGPPDGGPTRDDAGACVLPWADCDSDPSDCDTNLLLRTSCGACNTFCNTDHAAVRCNPDTYKCEIDEQAGGCADQYENCDGDGATGCEAHVPDDPAHCGRCDRSCGGGTCTTGYCGPEVLMNSSAESNIVTALVVGDKTFVINAWGGYSDVRRGSRTPPAAADIAGELIQSYSIAVSYVRGLTADATHVYWGVQGSPSQVFRYPLTGSGAVEIAFTSANNIRYGFLTNTATAWYWAHGTSTSGATGTGAIMTRAKAGGGDSDLVPNRGKIQSLVIVGNRFVWSEQVTDTTWGVFSAPLEGTVGNPGLVDTIADLAAATPISVSNGFVYWLLPGGAPQGRLQRANLATLDAQPVDVSVGLNAPRGIVTDDAFAYFTQGDNAVYKVPLLQAGQPVRVSTAIPGDTYGDNLFHVDEQFIYMPAGNGGSINLVRVGK